MYSLAFDLGTTTLVGYLIDMGTHGVIKTLSCPNPQIKYGLDILSRVSFAAEESGNKDILCNCLGKQIELMGEELSADTEGCPNRVVLVGNPVIMGSISGYEFSFPVLRVPGVGNYVGADALSGAFCIEQERNHENALLIDIGTNSEIVLLTDRIKSATSAAAGPALEGGNIECGMIGIEGAVDKVILTNTVGGEKDIIAHVIGEVPLSKAQGICGSGLIDLLAVLLRVGIIDNTGYLCSKTEALASNCPKKIAARIVDMTEGNSFEKSSRYFKLTEKIRLSQEDVRSLQLAISAIRSGIEVLFGENKLTEAVIDKIYLAGAFGNHIDIDSSLAVGIIPPTDRNKIRQAGNLAGIGACHMASEQWDIADVIKLKNVILTVSLESKKEFKDLFFEHMKFSCAKAEVNEK